MQLCFLFVFIIFFIESKFINKNENEVDMRPDIGYTQSMNIVFAQILEIVDFDLPITFWSFVSLENKSMKDYYDVNLTGVRVDVCVCDQLIREELSSLHEYFQNNDIEFSFLLLGPTMSLFANTLQDEDMKGVYTALLLFGPVVIFATWLTIFEINMPSILHVGDDSGNALQSLVINGGSSNGVLLPQIFKWCLKVSDDRIRQLREKYQDEIKENDDGMLTSADEPNDATTNTNADKTTSATAIDKARKSQLRTSNLLILENSKKLSGAGDQDDSKLLSLTISWIYSSLRSSVFNISTLEARESAKDVCAKLLLALDPGDGST